MELYKLLSRIKLFLRQFPFITPLGIIRNTKIFIDQQRESSDWYNLRKEAFYINYYESEFVSFPKPYHFENNYSSNFRINRTNKTYPSSLFYINSAFVFGDSGITLSKKNYLFNEFTHNFSISSLRKGIAFKPFHTLSFNIKKELRNAALLCSPQCTNYYHWLFDVLPRVKLLRDVLDSIEIFIVPKTINRTQIENLIQLGVKEDKLYFIEETDKIFFEHLYIPSLPGSEGYSPKWAIDYIRESFISKSVSTKKRRVYFTRSDVKQRLLINEDEIINILKRYHFEICTMSEFSFDEQVQISNSAEIIISVHGAALSNLVFASDCKVLEIFSPDYFRTDCFYTLANLVNLEYWYLEGNSHFNNKKLNWGDIYLSPDSLKTTLLKMNISE